jgi:hypothetical protein
MAWWVWVLSGGMLERDIEIKREVRIGNKTRMEIKRKTAHVTIRRQPQN